MKTPLPRFTATAAALSCTGALLWTAAIPDASAAPSARHRPHFHLRPNTTFSRRNSYRPNVKIDDLQSNFRGSTATPVTLSFSSRRGFVSRVELLVDGKVFWGTAVKSPASKGAFRIQLNLAKAGPGTHTLQARAWQGRQGYQSVHDLSKKRKFTN